MPDRLLQCSYIRVLFLLHSKALSCLPFSSFLSSVLFLLLLSEGGLVCYVQAHGAEEKSGGREPAISCSGHIHQLQRAHPSAANRPAVCSSVANCHREGSLLRQGQREEGAPVAGGGCQAEAVHREAWHRQQLVHPGVDNDEAIRINRGGRADPEGDMPGDLYVRLKACLIMESMRSLLKKAILGGSIQVPTLTGVRQGTQPGQKVALRGKGIKIRNSAVYGDQFVHFNVSIPTNLAQRHPMLIEEFAKEEQREDYKSAAAAAGASD